MLKPHGLREIHFRGRWHFYLEAILPLHSGGRERGTLDERVSFSPHHKLTRFIVCVPHFLGRLKTVAHWQVMGPD